MGCITTILWIPLLAIGGFLGFFAGGAIAGEIGALVGTIVGIFASQYIQMALWGRRDDDRRVPPPSWPGWPRNQ